MPRRPWWSSVPIKPFCRLYLRARKHTDSVEDVGAKKPLHHETIQIAASVIVSFQKRIFLLPTNLGMDLLIAELSVHREIINGGVKKDQCLLTGFTVVIVLRDYGCVAMFYFLIFWSKTGVCWSAFYHRDPICRAVHQRLTKVEEIVTEWKNQANNSYWWASKHQQSMVPASQGFSF